MNRRALVGFLVIATVAGFVGQALAVHAGLGGAGRPWLLATMWAPALAAVVSSRASRALALGSLRRLRWRHLALGLAVGVAIPLLHELALWAGGAGGWNAARFPIAPDGHGILGAHHVGLLLGTGPQPWGLLALNLLVSAVVGSVITALIGGLGEELGWRAVLQPELMRRWGALRGTLAVGLIWATWHVPVNLSGYNDDVHPLLTTFVLFPIGVVAAALALGWLVRRTGSVWPAALAHGAHNTFSSGLVLEAKSWAGDNFANLVAALIVGLVFGALLLRSARRPSASGAADPSGATPLPADRKAAALPFTEKKSMC